jgi:hypothetical protein
MPRLLILIAKGQIQRPPSGGLFVESGIFALIDWFAVKLL